MGDPPPNTPEEPLGKPPRTLGSTIRDSALELRPEAKPWREYFNERFPGMKLRKWVVLLILAVVLVCSAAYLLRLYDKSAMSYVRGQLDATGKTVEELHQQVKQTKEDAKQQISDLRGDFNSRISERDARIGQLVTQNEGLQNRVTQYELLTLNNNLTIRPNNIPVQNNAPKSRVLPRDMEDQLVSKISATKPLDTWIKVASSDPEPRELAVQIRDIFLRAGFKSVHFFTNPDRDWSGAELPFVGVKVESQELLEQGLSDALVQMLVAAGAKPGYTAGHGFQAPLIITVGVQ
jgi:hypothetical protein